MNTLKSRLELALANKEGATKAGLARACGVSKPAVSAWFSGAAARMGGEALVAAARYLSVRAEWLATGKGHMSPFGAPSDLAGIDCATGYDAASPDSLIPYEKDQTRRLPRLRWEQIGELQTVLVESLKPITYDESPFPAGPGSYTLELGTESMLPEYRPGEIIHVDPSLQARHGDDIIALVNGRPMFRRLVDAEDGQHLQALNPDWPDRLIRLPETAQVVGVIIGSYMTRRR